MSLACDKEGAQRIRTCEQRRAATCPASKSPTCDDSLFPFCHAFFIFRYNPRAIFTLLFQLNEIAAEMMGFYACKTASQAQIIINQLMDDILQEATRANLNCYSFYAYRFSTRSSLFASFMFPLVIFSHRLIHFSLFEYRTAQNFD